MESKILAGKKQQCWRRRVRGTWAGPVFTVCWGVEHSSEWLFIPALAPRPGICLGENLICKKEPAGVEGEALNINTRPLLSA